MQVWGHLPILAASPDTCPCLRADRGLQRHRVGSLGGRHGPGECWFGASSNFHWEAGAVGNKLKVTQAEVGMALSPLPSTVAPPTCPPVPRTAWVPLSYGGKDATAQLGWTVLLPLA